ncbi:unnamed protein product [Prunus brigantina]
MIKKQANHLFNMRKNPDKSLNDKFSSKNNHKGKAQPQGSASADESFTNPKDSSIPELLS